MKHRVIAVLGVALLLLFAMLLLVEPAAAQCARTSQGCATGGTVYPTPWWYYFGAGWYAYLLSWAFGWRP